MGLGTARARGARSNEVGSEGDDGDDDLDPASNYAGLQLYKLLPTLGYFYLIEDFP
jgi:hypothetical protein